MREALRRETPCPELLQALTSDCARCRGLCCTALCFAQCDGFPADKAAGVPCSNLLPDFRCAIHGALAAHGMRGCMAFDCLGTGPRVTAGGGSTENMAACFPTVRRLHHTLWYLHELLCLLPALPLWEKVTLLIAESNWSTPIQGAPIDQDGYEARASVLLHKAWNLTRERMGRAATAGRTRDFVGKDFKKADLSGGDFAMSLLIAANLSGCMLYGANFLGADMRDADVRGADLSECLFLTQGQIGAARGDKDTRLPKVLTRPTHW